MKKKKEMKYVYMCTKKVGKGKGYIIILRKSFKRS